MSARNRENRRVIRLRLKGPLRVVMGSLGADVKYDLLTRNISTTGFFLDFEKPGRFPFTSASIMEVWLELEKDNAIFFNGKMARVVLPSDPQAADTGPGIGIRIVQIDTKNDATLREFIDRKILEQQEKKDGAA